MVKEVYIASQYGCYTLACTGVRTILDLAFLEKLGDIGDFKVKLEKMQAEGHLSQSEKNTLHAIIETGHASAHRGFVPNLQTIEKLWGITLNLLEKLYIYPKDVEHIKSITPQRLRSNAPIANQEGVES